MEIWTGHIGPTYVGPDNIGPAYIFPGHSWTCLYSSIQRLLHEIKSVLLRCTLLRIYNREHSLAIHDQLSL